MYTQENLVRLANMTMPFGKYQGKTIIEIPEEYLLWYSRKGFPPGTLGQLLSMALEIRINGLEHLVKPLKGYRFDEESGLIPL